MALDASIYGNVGRFKSFNDYQNEAADQKLNQLRLLTGQQQYDTQKRAIDDENALRNVTSQFGDDQTANYNALLRAGRLDAAQKYQQGALTSQKTQGEIGNIAAQTKERTATADATTLASKIKASEYHLQQLGALTDPSQIDAWAAQGVKDGVMGMQESMQGAQQMKAYAAQYGFEAAKQQALRGGMSATEQLRQQLAQTAQQETARHNTATEQNAQAGLAEAARSHRVNEGIAGGHLTLARDNATATLTKPFEVTGADGTPQLVQMTKGGQLQPVPGYGPKAGSAKPLTEAQARDLGFGARMRESSKIIGDLTGQYSPMAVNAKASAEGLPGIGIVTGALANAMMSPQSQQAEQAQRDFVNALLRRESGAAISESEFQNARKQYFPQSGDSDAVLAQKARNRDLAMQGVMASVPPGRRDSIGPAGTPGLPSSDAISAELARRGIK
jgi:hypothetical protein